MADLCRERTVRLHLYIQGHTVAITDDDRQWLREWGEDGLKDLVARRDAGWAGSAHLDGLDAHG